MGIVQSLESAARKLNWRPTGTDWADCYEDTSYLADALEQKRKLVHEFPGEINPKIVWNLGASRGLFSRVASEKGIRTISFDIKPATVEKNHLECVEKGETNILHLMLDLTKSLHSSIESVTP